MSNSLGCVVLGFPLDGGKPEVFEGSTDAALRVEAEWLADPRFGQVWISAVFRITGRSGAAVAK